MVSQEYKPGDRVIYARGVKGPLIGKAGTIREMDTRDAPLVMAMVAFDDFGKDPFPCWVGNLDPAV